MKFLNQKGISFLQVIMASGMLNLIAMQSMSFLGNNQKMVSRQIASLEFKTLMTSKASGWAKKYIKSCLQPGHFESFELNTANQSLSEMNFGNGETIGSTSSFSGYSFQGVELLSTSTEKYPIVHNADEDSYQTFLRFKR